MSETTPVVGHLQTFKQGHVGHVVFSNPSKFNAVNYQMWCDLPVAMAQFAQDPGVRLMCCRVLAKRLLCRVLTFPSSTPSARVAMQPIPIT